MFMYRSHTSRNLTGKNHVLIYHITLLGLKLPERIDATLREAGIQDPYLRTLGQQLPNILLRGRADNTRKKYYQYFKKFELFITEKQGEALPSNSVYVSLFLTHLITTGSTFSVISSYVYAIRWAHNLVNHPDPTSHVFVQNILESSKRQSSQPVNRKDPITATNISELCEKYKDTQDFLIVRDMTMILFCFAGFLRYNEVSSLMEKDIQIHESHIEVYISSSKTDQYRLGNTVCLSKLNSVSCPVAMYKRYKSMANFIQPTEYIFRPVVRSGKLCKLIHKNKKLSYSGAKSSIVNRLKEVCDSTLKLGLHSLRSGGATAAANAGVNERCWKRHGRWRSEGAKDKYVQDSLKSRLSVSENLGL